MVTCQSRAAQRGLVVHDLGVVAGVGGDRDGLHQVDQADASTHPLQLAALVELGGHGDGIGGFAASVQVDDRLVDRLVRRAVEVLGLFPDEGVGRVGASVPGQASRSSEDEGSYTPHPEDLDMPHATPPTDFDRPDPTTFARLDGLGLTVIGQRLEPDRAVLMCRVVGPDRWCRNCGGEGVARDTVTRRLAHEPAGPAAHHAGRRGPPPPVPRKRTRVAPGHHHGGRAAGEALASRIAVGA